MHAIARCIVFFYFRFFLPQDSGQKERIVRRAFLPQKIPDCRLIQPVSFFLRLFAKGQITRSRVVRHQRSGAFYRSYAKQGWPKKKKYINSHPASRFFRSPVAHPSRSLYFYLFFPITNFTLISSPYVVRYTNDSIRCQFYWDQRLFSASTRRLLKRTIVASMRYILLPEPANHAINCNPLIDSY